MKPLDSQTHDRDSASLVYVYPVISRRARGLSIGINLNPNNACNFRCVYCQVPDLTRGSAPPIDLARLESELTGLLDRILAGDTLQGRLARPFTPIEDIAFSGNGEPTSSKEFPAAVALVARVIQERPPLEKLMVRVITNGSLIHQASARAGLQKLGELDGEAWFKVDAGTAEGIRRINNVELSPAAVSRNLKNCARLCRTWVQTCLFALDGEGPTESDTAAYLDVLEQAGVENLAGVHLYGLARPSHQPEAPRLSRLPETEFTALAQRLQRMGLTVRISP